ncbi:chaperone modulator CbpM [Algibacter mikhailovii]|uniref:MerR family transcriptional regulator n=1 Tax=Algibacter mikhailovii TaxID=425498 RepID=A0A918QZU4_9FLAO|nr:chaperone modulator CbpM [Algibacter mikhailovii]GGZ80640.1 hypothetical protein GCM10007028_17490 [Algibacter mikhailovii]
MADNDFIPISTLCNHYTIEVSFFKQLQDAGLVEIQYVEKTQCLHQNNLATFEKIIRIHKELQVNIEGIDVVLNLLERVEILNNELQLVKTRLGLYE